MHNEERICWLFAGLLGLGIGSCWPWLWEAVQEFPAWTPVWMEAGGGSIIVPFVSLVLVAMALGRWHLTASWAVLTAVIGTLYLTVLWTLPGALSWTGYVLYQKRQQQGTEET